METFWAIFTLPYDDWCLKKINAVDDEEAFAEARKMLPAVAAKRGWTDLDRAGLLGVRRYVAGRRPGLPGWFREI